jgi:hypothetical protein
MACTRTPAAFGFLDATLRKFKRVGEVPTYRKLVSIDHGLMYLAGMSEKAARLLREQSGCTSGGPYSEKVETIPARVSGVEMPGMRDRDFREWVGQFPHVRSWREPGDERYEAIDVSFEDREKSPRSEPSAPAPPPRSEKEIDRAIETLTIPQLKQLGVRVSPDGKWIALYDTLRALGCWKECMFVRYARYQRKKAHDSLHIRFGQRESTPCLLLEDLKPCLLYLVSAGEDWGKRPLPFEKLTVKRLHELGVFMSPCRQYISVFGALGGMGITVDDTVRQNFKTFASSTTQHVLWDDEELEPTTSLEGIKQFLVCVQSNT